MVTGQIQRVRELPAVSAPGVLYFMRPGGAAAASQYIGNNQGGFTPVAGTIPRFVGTFPVSATWVVNHNLGARPAAIRLLTTGGVEFDTLVVHTSDNQFIVSVNPPIAGQVIVQ